MGRSATEEERKRTEQIGSGVRWGGEEVAGGKGCQVSSGVAICPSAMVGRVVLVAGLAGVNFGLGVSFYWRKLRRRTRIIGLELEQWRGTVYGGAMRMCLQLTSTKLSRPAASRLLLFSVLWR